MKILVITVGALFFAFLALEAAPALGQVNRNPVVKNPKLPCHAGWKWDRCVAANLRAGRSKADAERWCDEGARRVAQGIPFTDCPKK